MNLTKTWEQRIVNPTPQFRSRHTSAPLSAHLSPVLSTTQLRACLWLTARASALSTPELRACLTVNGGPYSGITGPGAVQAYNEFYNSAGVPEKQPPDHSKGVNRRGEMGGVGMGLRFEYNEPGKEAVEAEVAEKQHQLRHDLDVQVLSVNVPANAKIG